MKQNNELPPGWDGESFQENPWANPQPAQPPPAPMNPATPAVLSSSDFATQPGYYGAQPVLPPAQPAVFSPPDFAAQSGYYGAQPVLPPAKPAVFSSSDFDSGSDFTDEQQVTQPAKPAVFSSSDFDSGSGFTDEQQVTQPAKPAVFSSSDFDSGSDFTDEQQITQPAKPAVFSSSDFDLTQEESSKQDMFPRMMGLIPIIIVFISFFAGFIYMNSKKQNATTSQNNNPGKDRAQTSVSMKHTPTETKPKTTTSKTTTKPQTTTSTTTETKPQTTTTEEEKPDYDRIAMLQFSAILRQYDNPMTTGYYEDYDGDARKELIIKDVNDMNFKMYRIQDDGTVQQWYFGYYPSVSEAKLFRVRGNHGWSYLYWRCDYSFNSTQGYYDRQNNNEIDVGIRFTEKNGRVKAQGKLWFNDTEENSGTEEVDSVYGSTPECYKALLSEFRQHNFQIDDSSDYTKMKELSIGELKRLFS